MPNPLEITLHSRVEETANDNGAAIDVGDRAFIELLLDASALAVDTSLVAVVEGSTTGTDGWMHLQRFDALRKPGLRATVICPAPRYVRARWTFTGSDPAATFLMRGTAHQLYATPEDLVAYGLPASALQGVPYEQQARACLASSAEAEGYLGSAYTLPLTGWDIGTRMHVAALAAFQIMRSRGFDADSGKDATLEIGRSEAITWLNRIANGKLRPPAILDGTPTGRETEVYVASSTGRSWRE